MIHEPKKVSIEGLCNECSYVGGHVEGCSLASPSDLIVKREYRSPTLTHLHIEKYIADAAAKWFKLEEVFENFCFNGVIPDNMTLQQKLTEVMGEATVLLLKKE